MALGSEGFFSPEGLQGGENRGGGRGEWPLREVGEEGSRGGCPPPPLAPPSPFSKVSQMQQEGSSWKCISGKPRPRLQA